MPRQFKPIPCLTDNQAERFWSYVEVHHPAGCWEWIGGKDRLGYGGFYVGRSYFTAHRLAYGILIGDPGNLCVDHLCRNRSCVNPDHLEPVSHLENMRRGYTYAAQNRNKRFCQHGHEFTEVNTHVINGSRRCRTCAKIKARIETAKRRGYTVTWEEAESESFVPAIPVKTTCSNGHAWTVVNIAVRADGRRECRLCRNERARVARLAKIESHESPPSSKAA